MSNILDTSIDRLNYSHSVYQWDDVIVVHPRGLPPSMTDTNVTAEIRQKAIEMAAIIYRQNLPITNERVIDSFKQRYGDGRNPTIRFSMVLWLNASDLSLKNALHIY